MCGLRSHSASSCPVVPLIQLLVGPLTHRSILCSLTHRNTFWPLTHRSNMGHSLNCVASHPQKHCSRADHPHVWHLIHRNTEGLFTPMLVLSPAGRILGLSPIVVFSATKGVPHPQEAFCASPSHVATVVTVVFLIQGLWSHTGKA